MLQPYLNGRVERRELADGPPSQEVMLHITDGIFHNALFVGLARVAGFHREPVVAGEICVARVEHGREPVWMG